MKQRIWELDAFRGLCILGMVAVHFVYDLVDLYGIIHWDYPESFLFIKQWGGVLFFLLSGICATLGRRSFRRGLIVFACGLVVSVATAGMYLLGFAGTGMIIYFGVLHCLGVCMMLWGLLKKAPVWLLLVISGVTIPLGLWLMGFPGIDSYLLMPLGLYWEGFLSSDYFPLLPFVGFFLLGCLLGRLLYKNSTTLLPKVNPRNPILRFLQFTGRQSLWVYLIHQPVLMGICMLLQVFL